MRKGIWSISETNGLVQRNKKESLYLEPRLALLFSILLDHANQLVPRDHLTQCLWPKTVVNEDALTRAVADLRKSLNSHFEKPPTIKTHHKRGYEMTLSTLDLRKPVWMRVLRSILITIGIFILLVLVIRGLNY